MLLAGMLPDEAAKMTPEVGVRVLGRRPGTWGGAVRNAACPGGIT